LRKERNYEDKKYKIREGEPSRQRRRKSERQREKTKRGGSGSTQTLGLWEKFPYGTSQLTMV